MPIPISCVCGQAFQANDSLAGKQAKCPKCGNVLVIPQSANQAAGFQSSFPASPPSNPAGFGSYGSMQSPLSSPSPMMGQSPFGTTPATWQTQQTAPKKKKRNLGLIIGLAIGGAVLVVGAVVAVVLVIVLSGDESEVAGKSGSNSSSSGSVALPSSGNDDLARQHERLIEELMAEFESLLSALQAVTDRDSAVAAIPAIDRARERVPDLLREGKALPRLSRSEDARLKQQFDSRMRSTQSKVTAELQRAVFRSRNEPQLVDAIRRLGEDWRRLGSF